MRRKLKVVRLRKPKVADGTQFIETLVYILDQARQGKILGYSTVFIVENEAGARTIEAACVRPGRYECHDAMHLLGAMRRMEANFMRRVWPEDK